MCKHFCVISLFLLLAFQLEGQTLISQNIDFSDTTQVHRFLTERGDQLLGRLQRIENDSFYFQMRNLPTVLVFHLSEVDAVWVKGENRPVRIVTSEREKPRKPVVQREMPTNQLLYSATALPYPEKGAYRNVMVLWNQVDFQPNPHLSIGGGILVPALVTLRLQGKVSITEFLHAGVAVQHYQIFYDEGAATHPYGMITAGDHQKFLNLTFGYWYRFGTFVEDPFPMLSLGGSYQISDRWRFYAEAMVVLDDFDNYVVPSFNVSTSRRRSMFEFGVVTIPDIEFPLFPQLSYHLMF